jgi:hypothetical protein
LHTKVSQHMAQRIGGLLQLRIGVATWGNGMPTGISSRVFNDGNAGRSIRLRSPTAATHLSHIEVLGYCPTKALLHGLVKVV